MIKTKEPSDVGFNWNQWVFWVKTITTPRIFGLKEAFCSVTKTISRFSPNSKCWLYIVGKLDPSNVEYSHLLQSQLHKPAVFHQKQVKSNHSLAAERRVPPSPPFFTFFPHLLRMSAPSDGDVFWECACYCQPGLSWQGREERITIFHSVCIVGAPEVTAALPLPLLDWSCQSRSAHVCVILNSQHSCRCGTLKWADFYNMYDYTWECGRCACVHRFMQSGKYAQLEAGREDVSYLLLLRSKCTQSNYSPKLFHGEKGRNGVSCSIIYSTPPKLDASHLLPCPCCWPRPDAHVVFLMHCDTLWPK